jgi:hypothetical protein
MRREATPSRRNAEKAWIVTAWKPEVLEAAERAGVVLPQPRAPEPLAEPGGRFARHERASLHDSPLAELFRPTS